MHVHVGSAVTSEQITEIFVAMKDCTLVSLNIGSALMAIWQSSNRKLLVIRRIVVRL